MGEERVIRAIKSKRVRFFTAGAVKAEKVGNNIEIAFDVLGSKAVVIVKNESC
jgi:hypothetical protein